MAYSDILSDATVRPLSEIMMHFLVKLNFYTLTIFQNNDLFNKNKAAYMKMS